MSDKKGCFSVNKKYLNKYSITNKKIADLEARFYDLFKVKNKTSQEQQIINDTLLRLDALLSKAADERVKIYECIDQLDDIRYIKILEYFFIYDMSISDISLEMNYSERHINRLYKDAVMSIDITD